MTPKSGQLSSLTECPYSRHFGKMNLKNEFFDLKILIPFEEKDNFKLRHASMKVHTQKNPQIRGKKTCPLQNSSLGNRHIGWDDSCSE